MAKAAIACAEGGNTPAKQCRADQKAAAKATGMEEKDWAGVKRQGEKESAAKGRAACSLTDATADECRATMKEQYQIASGSTDDGDWNAKKGEIKKVADAKEEGKNLKLQGRNQVNIEVRTSASACSDAMKSDFVEKIRAGIKDK